MDCLGLQPGREVNSKWRQFYRSVSNPESFLGDVSIRRLMGLAAPGEAGADGLAGLRVQIEHWRDVALGRPRSSRPADLGGRMKHAARATAVAAVAALLAETAYGMFAIADWPRVVAWVLLVECPTLILAIAALDAWVEA